MEARFLNATDRLKAVQRVEENMTGIKSDKFKWYQCREALIDPKAWALLVIQLSSNIANGGVHGVRTPPSLQTLYSLGHIFHPRWSHG